MKKLFLTFCFLLLSTPVFSATQTLTADGTTQAYWYRTGPYGSCGAFGTFGGGTLTLQASFDDGTTWINVGSNCEFTDNGAANFEIHRRVFLRYSLSGSTAPNLTMFAE